MLDLRHLGKEKIMEKLPQIWELSMSYAGVDPIEAPIPVTPGVHYSMGGIPTNINCETPMPGLYAAGECACASVHGANRLGGNALMETIVFGRRAGEFASEYAEATQLVSISDRAFKHEKARIADLMAVKDGEKIGAIREAIGTTMAEHFGILRTKDRMQAGIEKLNAIRKRIPNIGLQDHGKIFNLELVDALQLQSIMDLAETTATGAIAREESRGAHSRPDFPDRNDEDWMKHTLSYRTKSGPRLDYEAVTITKIPPAERKY